MLHFWNLAEFFLTLSQISLVKFTPRLMKASQVLSSRFHDLLTQAMTKAKLLPFDFSVDADLNQLWLK